MTLFQPVADHSFLSRAGAVVTLAWAWCSTHCIMSGFIAQRRCCLLREWAVHIAVRQFAMYLFHVGGLLQQGGSPRLGI